MYENIKTVIIGDGAVGKTALLVTFAENRFPEEYMPTIFENYNSMVQKDGKTYSLGLWDTAGQSDYERLRNLSYGNTDVFLIAFCINNPTSFHNLMVNWIPEAQHYCPDAQIILVGTKQDLRNDEKEIQKLSKRNMSMVTYEEGNGLADRLKFPYIECSALTRHNVKEVFELVIDTYLENKEDPNPPSFISKIKDKINSIYKQITNRIKQYRHNRELQKQSEKELA